MTCSYCNKTHSFVLSKVRNGTFIQVALCESHAKDFENPFVSKMNEVHAKTDNLILEGHKYDDVLKYSRENSNKKCTKCNIPVETFLATGVPTCDSCYVSFFNMVIAILDNYKELFAVFSDEQPKAKKENVSEIIEGYKKKLEKSIKKEDFVKAAEIRDTLRNIMERVDHESEFSGKIPTENESPNTQDSSHGENS